MGGKKTKTKTKVGPYFVKTTQKSSGVEKILASSSKVESVEREKEAVRKTGSDKLQQQQQQQQHEKTLDRRGADGKMERERRGGGVREEWDDLWLLLL